MPEPLWSYFVSPAVTFVVLAIGFLVSKAKLEQKVIDNAQHQEKKITTLEKKIETRCDNCPEILKLQTRHEITTNQIEMIVKTIAELQKDTRMLTSEVAKTNAKVGTAISVMSDSLSFLRSTKFTTAMEKILNGS